MRRGGDGFAARTLAVCLCAALTASAAASALAQPVPSPAPPVPHPRGEALPLTLAEAVFLGLRDNRDIRSAYAARVAEKYDLVVAERRFTPRLAITGSALATRQEGADSEFTDLSPSGVWLLPTGAIFDFSWARSEARLAGAGSITETSRASLRQPLLRGAGFAVNLAPVRIARLQEQVNRLSLKSTVANSVSEIIFAYRRLIEAGEQLRLAELGLSRSAALLDVNRAMIDAGRMAAADAVQTEADLAAQQLTVLQARRAREAAQLALLRLLAMDLHTNLAPADRLDPQRLVIDEQEALSLALENRMDYLGQDIAVEQARLEQIRARNDRLWDLSVVASVERFENPFFAPGIFEPRIGDTAQAIGLQLTIPLGDPSLKQGEIRATTALRIAELRLADLRQQVEAQVRDAVAEVDSSWQQYETARRGQQLAARALDIQREKLAAGRASNFEVLSADTTLRTAETQALSAAVGYLNALTVLDQQLGTTLDTWRIALND